MLQLLKYRLRVTLTGFAATDEVIKGGVYGYRPYTGDNSGGIVFGVFIGDYRINVHLIKNIDGWNDYQQRLVEKKKR